MPVGVISIVDGKAKVVEVTCIACESCVAVCPVGAISMVDGKAKVVDFKTKADDKAKVDDGTCIDIYKD